MAIGDMLFALMGQPKPSDMIAHALGHAPGQTGSPNAGIVPGQGGGVASIGMAGQGPNSPPDQNPQGGQQSQQPPIPQAYTTQPDLASTYLQLMQRSQANQSINSGLGLLAAGLSHNQQNRGIMVNAMEDMNRTQAGAGGASGMMGDLGKLIQTQREMAMQNYVLQHATEGAKSLGITPEQYLTSYATGQLGELEKSIIAQQVLQKSPQYQATLAETQARTGAIPADVALKQAQAGAIPSEVELRHAQAGAIPAETALKQAQTGAIPAETALKQAQTEAIPADVALKKAQEKKALVESTAPTDALRNYNFAVSQIPPGQHVPTFDEWQANQAGLKEAATQTNLLQVQQKMSAQNALPDAISKVRDQLALIDQISKDPNLDSMVGHGTGRAFRLVPGSASADLDAKLDQIAGATGVAAVESLKGVGRILGTEFTAGTEAQSRLHDRNVSPEAYRAAITDYANKLRMQLAIVTQKSGQAIPKDLQDWVPNEKGEVPGLKNKVKIWNPKTGDFE